MVYVIILYNAAVPEKSQRLKIRTKVGLSINDVSPLWNGNCGVEIMFVW
jgi:hypothetical protein